MNGAFAFHLRSTNDCFWTRIAVINTTGDYTIMQARDYVPHYAMNIFECILRQSINSGGVTNNGARVRGHVVVLVFAELHVSI